jgi:predicted PurR-regulated permease PerM
LSGETPEPAPPERPAWADLHLWQIQFVRDLLIGLGLLGLLLLGERLSLVTVPLLLALLLAYLFEPVTVRLARPRWMNRRGAAAIITLLGLLLVVVPVLLGAGFAVLQGVGFAAQLAGRTGAVIASVEDPADAAKEEALGEGAWRQLRDQLVELRREAAELERIDAALESGEVVPEREEETFSLLGVDSRQIARGLDFALNWVRGNAEQVGRQALSTGRGAVSAAVSTFTSVGLFAFGAFLTAFFFFFVSASWPGVVAGGREALPVANRERTVEILGKMNRAIHGFIRGRLTIAFFLGVFYTVGFWSIGTPVPLLLGPAIAVVTLVPYAALLAMPIVMVLMWLEGNTGVRGEIWWILIVPVALYQVGQALDDYVLTPLIQGKSTDLETPAILFASIAGGVLLGFYGLLVAIPLAACLKIVWKEIFVPRLRAWSEGRAQDFLPLEREG